MSKGLENKSIWRTYEVSEDKIKKLIKFESQKEAIEESYYDDTGKCYRITTIEEVQ